MLWYGVLLMHIARDRVRALRTEDRGASAIEFAIIAAVTVVAASIIGAVVYNIVKGKSEVLDKCANQPAGTTC
jgi:Flp pilus assembly pilin Flp